MNKLKTTILILFYTFYSHSKEFWQNFEVQGAPIDVKKMDLLVERESLLTCEHMRLRFEKLHSWMK
jgi:hypothetical protein